MYGYFQHSAYLLSIQQLQKKYLPSGHTPRHNILTYNHNIWRKRNYYDVGKIATHSTSQENALECSSVV